MPLRLTPPPPPLLPAATTKEFDTMHFFTRRSEIALNLTRAVELRLADDPVRDVTVLLGTVVLPESFSTAISNKVLDHTVALAHLHSYAASH